MRENRPALPEAIDRYHRMGKKSSNKRAKARRAATFFARLQRQAFRTGLNRQYVSSGNSWKWPALRQAVNGRRRPGDPAFITNLFTENADAKRCAAHPTGCATKAGTHLGLQGDGSMNGLNPQPAWQPTTNRVSIFIGQR